MSEPSEKQSQPLDYEQPAKPVEQVGVPRYRKIFSNILVLMGFVTGIIGCLKSSSRREWTCGPLLGHSSSWLLSFAFSTSASNTDAIFAIFLAFRRKKGASHPFCNSFKLMILQNLPSKKITDGNRRDALEPNLRLSQSFTSRQAPIVLSHRCGTHLVLL